MLKLDDYARIRQAHREGMSIRGLAKLYHHSRQKIREVLECPEPRPYSRSEPYAAPKLGPFQPWIDEILKTDEEQPAKQRHTAARIYRRLKAEQGYQGGYAQVQRYVAAHRPHQRETFIPLDHAPGRRMEFDFGEIQVDFPEGRRKVSVLIGTWAHSYAAFAIALPTQRTEAILHGMIAAFEHFGCVPKEVWWDNPKTVAVQILRGRDRRLNELYMALASHYNFAPLFCMPARGNEKPHVENRVKWLEREWATPVPRVADRDALNAYLRQRCREDRQRMVTGRSVTIAAQFEEDQRASAPLPERRFEACLTRQTKADKLQTVRFDKVSYSVPHEAAFQALTLKAYVDRVEIVCRGGRVATHPRRYDPGRSELDPLHYLVTLSRKPACLDHSVVYRDWKLPPVFAALRSALEQRLGQHAGSREFIQVLMLLRDHSLERVTQALEGVHQESPQGLGLITVAGIRVRVGLLRDHSQAYESRTTEPPASIPPVRVPAPDLHRYNQLLFSGEPRDDQSKPVTEDEPETAASANDLRGVRETGERGGDEQPGLRAIPVEPDRAGGGITVGERTADPDPQRVIPLVQGLRHLRLHGGAERVEAEDAGAGTWRVAGSAVQYVSDRGTGYWQNALGDRLGTGGLSPGPPGAVLHGGGAGDEAGDRPAVASARPVPDTA